VKKQPTIKQKKALERVLENHGNVSKSMREAGYSPNTAKNPKLLTDSIGWNDMLREYLPDELLMKVQVEGLNATTIKSSFSEPDKEVKDFSVRHKYLDTAYKLKGYLIEKKDFTTKGEKLTSLIQVNESNQFKPMADSSAQGQNKVQGN